MQRDSRVLLADVAQAAEHILHFTEGMDLEAYIADARTQAAVERKFEIIGRGAQSPVEGLTRDCQADSRIASGRRLPQRVGPWLCYRDTRTRLGLHRQRFAEVASDRTGTACRDGSAGRMSR